MTARRFSPHTVTFDCWQTLIYEEQPPAHGLAKGRAQLISEVTGAPTARVAEVFAAAWHEHQRAWHRRTVFAGADMMRYVLRALEVEIAAERQATLLTQLEDEILGHRVRAIDGAGDLLHALRMAGIRTALICDTGFSPGRVVRQLLARVGLLEHLEVHIFSDEVRVPKPHPRAFSAALEGLGVPAKGALHVGDLRRSDVAGARAAGMRTVRFCGLNDDADAAPQSNAGVIDCTVAGCNPLCARPEADAIVASYAELTEYLTARD
jgi:FMN phosphatase YigB (HAD superfamily)